MTTRIESGFSPRAVAWAAGIAVVSFLLAFVLAAFGEDLADPPTTGADSFSYSAIGHRALRDFLISSGIEVAVRRARATSIVAPESVLLVAEPGLVGPADGREEGLAKLYGVATGRGGSFLLVLPKWRGEPSRVTRRWVSSVSSIGESEAARGINALLGELALAEMQVHRAAGPEAITCFDRGGTAYRTDLPLPQFVGISVDFEPLVRCGDRVLIARGKPDTVADALYLVSDPDLINNHGLGRADHAAIVGWLMRDALAAASVVIDEIHHGHARSESLVAELLRFPLVLGVAHGLLVLGLVVWGGAKRLGKPAVDPPRVAGGKVALVDNAAQLLARGGHSVQIAREYFDQTLRAVASHYFVPTELAKRELIARLQTIADGRGVRIALADLGSRLDRLEPRHARSIDRAVKLALELHRWREEMTDATRRDP